MVTTVSSLELISGVCCGGACVVIEMNMQHVVLSIVTLSELMSEALL